MNKPCPFCGVTPTLGVLNRDDGFSPKDGGNVVHHGDEECPAEGFYSLEVWNRRASPPPAEGLLRECLDKIADIVNRRLAEPGEKDETETLVRIGTVVDAALAEARKEKV